MAVIPELMHTPPICPICGERCTVDRKVNQAGDEVVRYRCTITLDWADAWRR